MTEPNGDQILYNNLLAEVQKVHAAMAKAAEDARVREESVTRFREVLVSSMDRFSDEMAENRKQMFAIADAKTIAQQVGRDLNTHLSDHRWVGKAVVWTATTLSTVLAGTATYIVKNADRLSEWFHRLNEFGKPPHQ